LTSPRRSPLWLGLVEVAALLAVAGFLAGLLGKVWWVFDLASHFRIQYAVALLAAAALFALARHWRSAVLSLLPGLAITGLLGASLLPHPSAPEGDARFKIVSFNVHTANTKHHKVLDYLRAEDADFLFLMEVDAAWIAKLRPLAEKYPHRIELPREDNFGIAAYSKQPFTGPGAVEFEDAGIPMLDVTLRLFGADTRLLGVHTLPPVRRESSRLRNLQLSKVSDSLARTPALLFGDFNITPFSPWYREIFSRSGLRNAAVGHGYFPTWAPFGPMLSLPIDHVFVPPQLDVMAFRIGPACGSDHHPLAVTLAPRQAQ
jgi:endonuclease/exonuclease/phosphatase (EEP) superfamily protein YafD